MTKMAVSVSMEVEEYERHKSAADEHGESLSSRLRRLIAAGERLDHPLFTTTATTSTETTSSKQIKLPSDHARVVSPSGDKRQGPPSADGEKREERAASPSSNPPAQGEMDSHKGDACDEGRSEDWPSEGQLARMGFAEKVFNCVSATPRTASEVSEHTGLNEPAVEAQLEELLDEGEILGDKRTGEWRFWTKTRS